MDIAAVQMVSGTDVAHNCAQARRLIARAAQAGAQLVCLPEYWPLMGRHERDKCAVAEHFGAGPLQDFLAEQARTHGIYLVGGTIPLRTQVPDKVFNTLLAYDPSGQLCCRYDKIHLFGFANGEEIYQESRTIVAGSQIASFSTPGGRVAVAICYDLRFPELFRALSTCPVWRADDTPAPSAQDNLLAPYNLMLLPAAFTHTTGLAHWEILLRARAIENQCYVLAAAQGGLHENGRRTYGHSMLIDPWGQICDMLPEGEGCVIGSLSSERIECVRAQLPALRHRRLST